MIAGFEQPTSGEILLDGTDVAYTPAHQRNVNTVFQNYALFPHLNVYDNIAFGLKEAKRPKAEIRERVGKALELVQLPGHERRKSSQLSGGQQQRVALARALVFDPQLVLMDEPLGALDKQLREHMQIELKELHRRLGVTFVYVTHDQSEALAMSDRVAVFNDGALQQIDRVERLYDTPANRFVAGFVGDNTVLDGVVVDSTGSECTVRLPSGCRVTGVDVNGAEPGAQVRCCIRPERLELTSVLNQVNTFEATVEDVIYFGDHLRLRCTVPGQPDAMVKFSLGRHDAPARGEAVLLYAAQEHLRVYV
jgi:putative spermidine/putrescine transport system ATP-binding protein